MDAVPVPSVETCLPFRAQFPAPPDLTSDVVEDLLAQETLSKPLSALYFILIKKDSPKMEVLWSRWGADIPTLDRESCEERFEESFKLVISSRDKLVQAKFFHRTYLTPQRLHRIYPERSLECPRCRSPDSSYIHMFWSCPRLLFYWSAIMESINARLQLELPLTPELALLAIHDDQRPRYTKLLISLLLFYAKKGIVLKWNSHSSPTVKAWENSVNAVLPLYKLTYINRVCPQKFMSVASLDGPWMRS